jgi:hypothetical protein
LRATNRRSGFLGVLAAFEQLHGRARHDGGNRVLVDELGMAVAAQQNTEIVESCDHALKLHTVHQEDCQWNLVLPHVVQERILKILSALSRHLVAPVCWDRAPFQAAILDQLGSVSGIRLSNLYSMPNTGLAQADVPGDFALAACVTCSIPQSTPSDFSFR